MDNIQFLLRLYTLWLFRMTHLYRLATIGNQYSLTHALPVTQPPARLAIDTPTLVLALDIL